MAVPGIPSPTAEIKMYAQELAVHPLSQLNICIFTWALRMPLELATQCQSLHQFWAQVHALSDILSQPEPVMQPVMLFPGGSSSAE